MTGREHDWRDYEYEWLLTRVEVLEDMVRTFLIIAGGVMATLIVMFVGWF